MVTFHRRAYWRLTDRTKWLNRSLRFELGRRGRNVKKSARKAELVQHLEHADRSLLDYTKCNADELLGFTKARGLLPKTSTLKSRAELTELLTHADQQPSFGRFLDLPAELRNYIYEFYVDTFGRHPDSLTAPPLAQIRTHIRNEVLPVFYKRCTFQLDFMSYQSLFRSTTRNPRPVSKAACFFAQLSSRSASDIRNILITITDINHRSQPQLRAIASVNLGKGKGPQKVVFRHHLPKPDDFRNRRTFDTFRAAFARVRKDVFPPRTVRQERDGIGLATFAKLRRALCPDEASVSDE